MKSSPWVEHKNSPSHDLHTDSLEGLLFFIHGALKTDTGACFNMCPCIPDWIGIWQGCFCGEDKTREPREKPLKARREPTTNLTHMWRLVSDSNSGHIGGRRGLSPLNLPCSLTPPLLPTKQNLKWKYEHKRDKRFYSKPGDEYQIHVHRTKGSLVSQFWEILHFTGSYMVAIIKPRGAYLWEKWGVEDSGENDQLDMHAQSKENIS